MQEIKIYKSPWQALKLILICMPFIVLGIFIITREPANPIGWLNVGFFGLSIPLGLTMLLDRRPQIIINEIGIFDRTLHNEFINWEVIRDAYPISINKQKFISLVIDDEFKPSRKKGKLYKNTARLNEYLGAQELNLNLSMVKIDEVKLTLFIKAMINTERSERGKVIAHLGS